MSIQSSQPATDHTFHLFSEKRFDDELKRFFVAPIPIPNMFNVVLVEPEIPPNTGNVGRLCLATNSRLHLVRPLGFSLEDKHLKRAGLDYWDEVQVSMWDSLTALEQVRPEGARAWYLTTKATRAYWDAEFRP